MKKLFTFVAVLATAMAVAAQNSAATFEDITVGTDSLYRSDKPTEAGQQTWMSGDYLFTTYVDSSAYGTYYYDIAVSARKANDFVNDYSTGYDMKSAAGGAAEGQNYAVWYNNYYGNAHVLLDSTATISGMYVTNNSYAASSMQNGDAIAKKFADGDWFKLTISGYRASVGNLGDSLVNTLDFYLADFRNGKSEIVTDWRWVDLTGLGQVDAIGFSLSSSDNGQYGMNTPAYFCLDNLGGEAPSTGLQDVQARDQASKVFRNGQLLILKGGHAYSMSGIRIY